MKENFIIAVVCAVASFGLMIASIILCAMSKSSLCMHIGMGSCVAGFISCLFGLNSWKEE